MTLLSRRFIRRWCLPAIGLLLFASCGGGSISVSSGGIVTPGTADDVVTEANSEVPANTFTATLLGATQVPPNSSTASGTGIVIVDPALRILRASVTTAGVAGTAAHIVVAPFGQTGLIVFSLTETTVGSGIWTTETSITDDQLNALHAGQYFFNVLSSAFPQGEIRGQILQQLPGTSQTFITDSGNTITDIINNTPFNPVVGTPIVDTGTNVSADTLRRTMLTNVLTASQRVPAPVPSVSNVAVAISVAIIDHVDKTLTASITSLGISGSAAHAHQAAAGNIGPAIVTFGQTSADSGIWVARANLSAAQITSVTDGDFYLDIHTSAAPDGAIRGQIVQTSGTTIVASNDTTSPITTNNNIGTAITGTGSSNPALPVIDIPANISM